MPKPKTRRRPDPDPDPDSDLMREAMGDDAPESAPEDAADVQEAAGRAEPIEVSGDAAELIQALQAERDEAVDGRMRALADFANFQRRASENERRAGVSGAAGIVRSLLSVLDNFELALSQDTVSLEQLSSGLQLVYDELVRALETHGVARIEPAVGDEFDPNRHEAMYQQPSEEHPPNSVVQVLQTGYAIGDLVLRAAKVAVSPGEGDGDA